MTHAQTIEHAKWRRLFTVIIITIAFAYVVDVLWTETAWREFFNEYPELWIILVTAFVTWTVCSVFWLLVLSMLKVGHDADERAEADELVENADRINRFKSRVDGLMYGGREVEK